MRDTFITSRHSHACVSTYSSLCFSAYMCFFTYFVIFRGKDWMILLTCCGWWWCSCVTCTRHKTLYPKMIRPILNLLWVQCYIYPRSEELTNFIIRVFSSVDTCLQNVRGLRVIHLPIIFHSTSIINICIKRNAFYWNYLSNFSKKNQYNQLVRWNGFSWVSILLIWK